MSEIGIRAVDAFSEACHARPSLARDENPRKGVSLYGWNTGPVDEVHIAETRELILTVHLAGSRRVRVVTEDGLSRSVSKPGDITLIPRGQPVSFRTEGAVDFATVHFPVEASASRDSRHWLRALNVQACIFALRDEYVVASVRALMQSNGSPSRDSSRYFSQLIDSLGCHLARIVDDRKAEQILLPTRAQRGIRVPDFAAVLKLVEERLADKLTLDHLAESAGIGRAMFAREFTERYGCTPHRYLNQRRIERAKQLLAGGQVSLVDIAYEVGFSGHSHFTTTFRAFEGCTPKAWSRAALSGR